MCINIKSGIGLRMTKQLLHIFDRCAVGNQIGCKSMTERVKMKILHTGELLFHRPAHKTDRTCALESTIHAQTHKGYAGIALRDFLTSLQ